MTIAGAVVVALGVGVAPRVLVVPASAAPDEDAAREQEAADAALERARAAVAEAVAERAAAQKHLDRSRTEAERAQRASQSPHAGLRRTEGKLVTAVHERRQARARLEEATARALDAQQGVEASERALRHLEREVAAVDAALTEALATHEDRVATAYKHGSVAASTGWLMGAVREARSPGDVTIAAKHLGVLSADAFAQVERTRLLLAQLQVDRARAVTDRDRARVALAVAVADAEGAVADARAATEHVASIEATIGVERAAAHRAEAAQLAAWERALAREEQAETDLARAEEREQRARDEQRALGRGGGDGPPDRPDRADRDDARQATGRGDDLDDEELGALEDRRTWLDDRRRWLARSQARPAGLPAVDEHWWCPVEGGRFTNDWGYPRSEARRHQGTDVFAAIGTPVVAPIGGEVLAVQRVDRYDGRRGRGGITVTIGDANARVYLAHLDAIAAGIDRGDQIEAGEVVGTVGRTGNARGTEPHLHLGWYVEDLPINPYPTLAVACAPPGD